MELLASEHRGLDGMCILSTTHQKPLGRTAKPLGVGAHCPLHQPKPEDFLPNCSGSNVTESPTSPTQRNRALAVVVDFGGSPRGAVNSESLNLDLPRDGETLPEGPVCPPCHQQLRPC